MTYPMPRDNFFLDPSGAVTAAPGEAYRNEGDQNEDMEAQATRADDVVASDEGADQARYEEAHSAEGDADDDADLPAGSDEDVEGDEGDQLAERQDDGLEDDDVDNGEFPDDAEADDEAVSASADAVADEGDLKDDTADDHDAAPDDTALDDTALDGAALNGVAAVAGGMHPGDGDVKLEGAMLDDSHDLHDRLQQAQLSFIDDPRGAAESARSLAAEVLEAHISALRDRQEQLNAWQSQATPDTEVLRAAMRAYRDMVNSLSAE